MIYERKMISGWKAFHVTGDPQTAVSRCGVQFSVGEITRHSGPLVLAESGLHFCPWYPLDVDNYYSEYQTIYGKVEVPAGENVLYEYGEDPLRLLMACASALRLVRLYTRRQFLQMTMQLRHVKYTENRMYNIVAQPDLREYARQSEDFREWWIQRYKRENFRKS